MKNQKTLEVGLCEGFDGERCRINELIEIGLFECGIYSNGECRTYCREKNIKKDRFVKLYVKNKSHIN